MKMIPKLETFLCMFSLRTGTKIIGLLQLIYSIFFMIAVPLFYFGLMETMKDDTTHPELHKGNALLLVKTAVYAIFINDLFQAITAVLLLVGVYQNKTQFFIWWIFLSLIELISGISSSLLFNLSTEISLILQASPAVDVADLIEGLILGAFQLYSILVVYNYYREVRKGSGNRIA